MRSQIISVLLLFAASYSLYSQERVGVIEGELALGLVGGAGHDSFDTSQSGEVYTEIRFNIPNSPLSMGLQLGVVKYSREEQKKYRHEHTTIYTDYNYRPHRAFNIFGGIGIGYGETIRSASNFSPNSPTNEFRQHFTFAPRLGVELFNTLRLSLESKILMREYTYWGLSLGLVIGGRQIK